MPAIGAVAAQSSPYRLDGNGVTVAVIDSGVQTHDDLIDPFLLLLNANRVINGPNFSTDTTVSDRFGHGTHVAGLIGGNGRDSRSFYRGVAPEVRLLSVKVSNARGEGKAPSAPRFAPSTGASRMR